MYFEVLSFYGFNVFNDNIYIIDDIVIIFYVYKNY